MSSYVQRSAAVAASLLLALGGMALGCSKDSGEKKGLPAAKDWQQPTGAAKAAADPHAGLGGNPHTGMGSNPHAGMGGDPHAGMAMGHPGGDPHAGMANP
ncbi:MAG: hypothetical protein AAGC55_06350, partial [Myxococcota bacterium]